MNRTYTKEEFYRLVSDIREICPTMSISTDIIIGFPTETYEDYLETEEVLLNLCCLQKKKHGFA